MRSKISVIFILTLALNQALLSQTASRTIHWTKATDADNPQNTVKYLVCQSTLSLSSVATIPGCKGSTIIMPLTTDVNAFTATGLTPGMTYFFNALASDPAGNTMAYAPLAFTAPVQTGVPAITSAGSGTATVGVPFSYQVTATNTPTSFSATGLPPGLSINPTTGLISGTPTTTTAIGATNASGTGTISFTITVINPLPPVISSPGVASGTVGTAFSYQIAASNNPTSFGATGLPAGLAVNSGTGLISGTPTTAGVSSVTLSATNAGGASTAPLVVTVANPLPPVVSNAITGAVGTAFSYQITASNNPTSFSAAPLPPGLSVNSVTGLISGTPTAAGTTAVTLSATNAGGTGTLAVSLTFR